MLAPEVPTALTPTAGSGGGGRELLTLGPPRLLSGGSGVMPGTGVGKRGTGIPPADIGSGVDDMVELCVPTRSVPGTGASVPRASGGGKPRFDGSGAKSATGFVTGAGFFRFRPTRDVLGAAPDVDTPPLSVCGGKREVLLAGRAAALAVVAMDFAAAKDDAMCPGRGCGCGSRMIWHVPSRKCVSGHEKREPLSQVSSSYVKNEHKTKISEFLCSQYHFDNVHAIQYFTAVPSRDATAEIKKNTLKEDLETFNSRGTTPFAPFLCSKNASSIRLSIYACQHSTGVL